ncbi:MAG TPA: hypothetical protein VMJ10_29965 [Kofleriaceae bacterium]|nr:hypothetical protein [Kofleriaceae bacterium]
MATAARRRAPAFAALGVAAAIWATVLAIVATVDRPAVPVAAAFDLTVTCSLAVYLIAVRRGHLPRWVLTIVALAGAIAARVLLAGAHASIASAAVIEAFAIAMVVGRGGRVTELLTSELRVLGHAIAGWRAPRRDARTFTVHRANGWPLYAGVLVALTLVETPVVHVALVGFGHPTAAWIATALSLYGAIWFVGDALALRHGGVVVGADAIELRVGVRWRGRIARAAIARVERTTTAENSLDVSILTPNVILHLREPVTLHGLLGRRRTSCRIALSIDEPDRFIALLHLIVTRARA